QLAAPTGDGRIYYLGGAGVFGYFDAANTAHQLLDIAGTAQQTQSGVTAIIFDQGTNSLISAQGGLDTTLTRYTLDGAGTQVVATASTIINISNGEVPMGMNRGPAGTIYIHIDDNSNNLIPRMQLLDPVAMTTSAFASNAHGAMVAGAYSSVVGKSVVLDSSSDNFVTFVLGQANNGTVVATGVSTPGGHSEAAQLVEILTPGACPTDLDDDGDTDGADLGLFLAAWGPGPGPTDLDNDGDTDGADLGLFLALWGPC
ncbi:MAG: hypothetical protein ACYTF7_10380, partial [Planctomycetota bacterium]